MPNTRIEIKRGWIGSQRSAVIEAVHAAMVETIRIPEHDRALRPIEHDPADFSAPPDKSDKYTLIEIPLFTGRSMEAKRNLSALGVPPMDIKIVLVEVPAENWGVRGGEAASEIDLGF